MERVINLTVNGQQRELQVNDADTLLEILRDGLMAQSGGDVGLRFANPTYDSDDSREDERRKVRGPWNVSSA